MSEARFASYADFWPHYLREHSRRRTRALHYIGTALVIVSALALILSGRLLWAAIMPVAGYGSAWFAHLAVERNRPATFGHPIWSLISDFRMFGLAVGGRLGRHLDSAGVDRTR